MNSRNLTAAERRHLGLVKDQPCAVCGAAGPSEAHHIKQGQHFTAVALCTACHRGPHGIHGDQSVWKLHKLDELAALNVTLARLSGSEPRIRAYKAPSKIIPRAA